MKFYTMIPLLAVLLTLVGCSTTVQGTVADPFVPAESVVAQNAATQGTADTALLIGEDQAKKIALEQAELSESDVTRLRVEYEVDDGVQQYDVEFRQGGYEYEYEINANTGAVISFDRDKDD